MTDVRPAKRRPVAGHLRRAGDAMKEEMTALQPRLHFALLLMSLMPPFVGNRVRVCLLRWAYVSIGTGTVIWGRPTIVGLEHSRHNLVIGDNCVINDGCHFDACGPIEIGDNVSIGQQVMILTNAHELADGSRRAGPNRIQPVRVERGAWLSTRCTLLPGITVGEGAVVAAGAVVNCSVAPNTLVGGVPARFIRTLSTGDEPTDVSRGRSRS